MAENRCKIPKGHEFHTPLYEDLLKKVVPLRGEYRKIGDIEGRKQMAKEELDAWTTYQEMRKEEIS